MAVSRDTLEPLSPHAADVMDVLIAASVPSPSGTEVIALTVADMEEQVATVALTEVGYEEAA